MVSGEAPVLLQMLLLPVFSCLYPELTKGHYPDDRHPVSTECGFKGMAGPLQAEWLKGTEG